jgi:hypothetical protein
VAILECSGGTALGSSLHSGEALLIWMLPSSCCNTVKIVIFFLFFIACFLRVKNISRTSKIPYNRNPVKAVEI